MRKCESCDRLFDQAHLLCIEECECIVCEDCFNDSDEDSICNACGLDISDPDMSDGEEEDC